MTGEPPGGFLPTISPCRARQGMAAARRPQARDVAGDDGVYRGASLRWEQTCRFTRQ